MFDDRVPDTVSAKRGRVRLSREAVREVALAFNERGAAAIQAVIDESPLDFLRLVAALIPKPDALESQNETPLNQLSDTELDQLRESISNQLSHETVLIGTDRDE